MKRSEERSVLENLINNSAENLTSSVAVPGNNAPELVNPSAFEIDFDELKSTCDAEAKSMVENAVSFVLSKEVIDNNEYVKAKIGNDIFSLSGMLYQLRCNERMQRALMEEIARGAMHPRMFEVFGQLSKTIGELNKQLIQTVEAIKMSTKDIKLDIKEKQTELLGPQTSSNGMLTTSNGNIITMGTKEMIKKIKQEKREVTEDQITDIEEVK